MSIDPKQFLMGQGYVLTQEDRDKFVLLWKDLQSRQPSLVPGHPKFPDEEEITQAADFYVANITMAVTGLSGLTVGSGEATVYQLAEDTGQLEEVEGHVLSVYQTGETEIAEGSWVQVAKDKYGRWWAVQGGGGGTTFLVVKALENGSIVRAEVQTCSGQETGTGTNPAELGEAGAASGTGTAGTEITVGKFPYPPREDFETGGCYVAFRVGSCWICETGPKTTCIEVMVGVQSASFNCTSGALTINAIFDQIRIIERPCGPDPDGVTGTGTYPFPTGT